MWREIKERPNALTLLKDPMVGNNFLVDAGKVFSNIVCSEVNFDSSCLKHIS